MSRKYSRFSTAPRAAGHQVLLILASFLFCLLGLTTATYGKGLNASHFTADDCLGVRLAGGNTRYTPNLDLYSNLGPDVFGWNLLQNQSLDEVFLKITFKAGVTPSVSKLVDIRYGDEFVFAPGDPGFYSRVVGQDLLVWYGFQNRGDFGRTIVTSDNQWTFTVVGDFPVVGVYAFISYHSNTAGDMPDLLPLSESRLYLLPDPTSDLYTEKPTDPVPRKPLG